MRHRVDVLITRYCLRARSLPGSCLLSLLSTTLPVSRIKVHLEKNPLFLALPSPPPSSDARLKTFFRQYRERQGLKEKIRCKGIPGRIHVLHKI
ncbi:hypothetical protein G6F37_013278 [Rhizopus arrhizus]|nr:hypothetical protein G6F37_013278 [Rhizopus arrhizus]